jgi:hypothetical protein
MDIKSKILHNKLVEIKKKETTIRLFFRDGESKQILRFEGLLFETPLSPLNKTVINVENSRILGIKAVSQLRYENKNPNEYKQLLIQMDNFGEWKSELICVYKNVRFE